ncbi:hypothetical protein DPMN_062439 [Dreissena polymorpha]|uniref:Uncharacterized protein n=1 Tax=Dreissena polymorpha TaxID=45954 RepID=A0A9D4C8S6_DREPO|nr:hypothetical protein DPMN_062439 [Dreissena polymorpha]
MVLLLLNILVVIGMVICRNPSKARKAKEPKQCGDLDLSTYRPKKPDETRKNFFEKLNWLPKWKQQSGMPGIPYLPMENGNVNRLWKPEEKYSQTSSTFLPVLRPQMVQPCDSLQKHYETQEDSYLEHTYEEPMSVAPSRPPSCRETGLQHSSLQELSCMACSFETESDDYSSPTKYFPRSTEEPHNVSRHMEEPRTVSFALPQGTYLTIQDRVDSCQSSQTTEKERTPHGGEKSGGQ